MLSRFKRFELLLLIGLMLAVTVPFIGQAVQHDAHQFIDFAKMELDHPLWQHLQDYSYFGDHYYGAAYHDTHPRLQSLYLAGWLAITGSLAVQALHLEMLIFPLIAVIAMYFLARRFRVNAFIATLLLVVAPAFLVANHLIMIDVPGMAFWLAATILFIHGTDENKLLYLLAGGFCLTLGVFTYYQDLSLIPLLLVYLLIKGKFNRKTLIALAIPVVAFLAFTAAHYAYYSDPPNFTYTFGQPMDWYSILVRIRGNFTVVGGALIFPLAIAAIFSRIRWINISAFIVLVVSSLASVYFYLYGGFAPETMLLLPWMTAAGVMIVLFLLRKFFNGVAKLMARAGGGDDIFLCVWFFGVFFYNCILLPYPSTRYLVPLLPPLLIFTTREIQRLWGAQHRLLVQATAVIAGMTLLLSLGIAVGEHERANENPVEADWAVANFPPDGHVWYNGGLGFQYYMQEKGYPMALKNGDGLQVGDYIIESVNNRWIMKPKTISRLELVETVDFPSNWPIATEFHAVGTSWLGIIGMDVPYGFTGEYLDRIYVYRVWMTADEADQCWLSDET